MSEKEERIIRNISKALPHMSEFDKGYVLGLIDSKVSEKRERSRHEPEPQAV